MALLEVVLLGGFQVRLGGQAMDVPGRKERALLAFLAMPAGEPRSRDKLAGLLWSDRGDKQARDSLKQAILKLRKSFDSVRPKPIQADRESVTLDGGAVTVDVAEFERLVGEGTPEALARASALYRGDLLDGIDLRDPAFDDWLLMERQRLRDLARNALAKLLDLHMADGVRDQAAAVARRLLALDPLWETAHRALMQIYGEQGQTALALKQYQLCRDALQSELGVRPEAETEQLHRSIQEKRAGARQMPDQPPAAQIVMAASPPVDQSTPGGTATFVKPSIAVLPFTNLSADPEQQYFSDGITEDIITELSRYRSLLVIGCHSCFQFRQPSVDIETVRRKLNVHFVVEGSIRKVGRRLQLTARLIDAATESHVWAERYDREVEDILAVQDELTRTIVATLEGRIAASGAEQAKRRPTKEWMAYDYLLQGRDRQNRYKFVEAEPFFARAVELDPGYAPAYAWWAMALLGGYWQGQSQALEQAMDCARKALSLDDTDAWCHMVMGFVLAHRGQLDAAGPYFERAISLNPNNVQIAIVRAWWLARMGRTSEALEYLDIVTHREPYPPDWFWEILGIALMQARRYEAAIDAICHMSDLHAWDHSYLAACYAHLNHTTEAHDAASAVLRMDPHFTVSRWGRIERFKNPTDHKHLLEGLRKAGLPE
ncbi:MAG TPA: BTAD domain-containing putative transcriptional regulator [Alphaproteobacteria bacterium]|nr:BTAD domain-containing putative transcriptional regulator [Alphaproteobacteria bacterium]